MKEIERLLNVREAAKILGVSAKSLYQWNWKKRYLPFTRIGGSLRISEKDLMHFIEKGKRPPEDG